MSGFIMLGCPNWNKKVDIFNTSYSCDRLNALFEKTNDPEDFLSFAKIQFKVQQDGCTVSKPLIGRALNRKKFQVEPSWGERVSKNGARKSDRL